MAWYLSKHALHQEIVWITADNRDINSCDVITGHVVADKYRNAESAGFADDFMCNSIDELHAEWFLTLFVEHLSCNKYHCITWCPMSEYRLTPHHPASFSSQFPSVFCTFLEVNLLGKVIHLFVAVSCHAANSVKALIENPPDRGQCGNWQLEVCACGSVQSGVSHSDESLRSGSTERTKVLLERMKQLEAEKTCLVLENERQCEQYEKCLDDITSQVLQAVMAQRVTCTYC